jgi:nitroimidazol reductase NimA-like FMN-containing flavoprotein (pyridoxamine 5'-phosphate oxidase superfamily)
MTRPEGPTSESASPEPTTSDPFSFETELGTDLIELDREECLELLAVKPVGRIAYAADYGARILPVNYVLADDSIIFRTVPDGEIFHHALSSVCAFEIDEIDEFFESGWSVVAVGRLELATGDDFDHMRYGKLPQPWATGSRYMFVRLPCTQVSGRRVNGHGR